MLHRLDELDTPEGFKAYQCMECGCVGIKNIAEALHSLGILVI